MTSPTADLSIPRLRAELTGRVIAPEDADYDAARQVLYGGTDQRPAVIARVAGAADVARVVALARETGLELAVRSGGHSGAGHSTVDGGIVLDLRDMKALEIDADGRTAWAETGLTAGEYTNAVGAHGLATGFGDTGSVGIGGITLGGGVGFLSRKQGLTIDNLLAAELVTADGELLRVDAESHPDLFWAIRGGGGNFGVATRFQFRLHEVPGIVGGMLMLPATADVIASFVALAQAAPEELTTIATVMKAPPMPFVPAEVHGKPVVMALVAYTGDPEEGERVLAPFRSLATPIADLLQPMPYAQLFQPEGPDGRPLAAARNMFLDTVDPDTAQVILDRIDASTAFMAVTQLRVLGGAVSRVPADATAYAHRHHRIMANVAALYLDPGTAATHGAWVDGLTEQLRGGDTSAYVNFIGDEGADRVRDAYPKPTWERLAAIKDRYDPTNLFRRTQNVPPAGGA